MKSKTYDEFVEKFKPKKTTDDCYTPPLVYDAVRDWACEKYGIDRDKMSARFILAGTMKVLTTQTVWLCWITRLSPSLAKSANFT